MTEQEKKEAAFKAVADAIRSAMASMGVEKIRAGEFFGMKQGRRDD